MLYLQVKVYKSFFSFLCDILFIFMDFCFSKSLIWICSNMPAIYLICTLWVLLHWFMNSLVSKHFSLWGFSQCNSKRHSSVTVSRLILSWSSLLEPCTFYFRSLRVCLHLQVGNQCSNKPQLCNMSGFLFDIIMITSIFTPHRETRQGLPLYKGLGDVCYVVQRVHWCYWSGLWKITMAGSVLFSESTAWDNPFLDNAFMDSL